MENPEREVLSILEMAKRRVEFHRRETNLVLILKKYNAQLRVEKEENALQDLIVSLPKADWTICQHKWPNRGSAPSLLIIQKNDI